MSGVETAAVGVIWGPGLTLLLSRTVFGAALIGFGAALVLALRQGSGSR